MKALLYVDAATEETSGNSHCLQNLLALYSPKNNDVLALIEQENK